MAVKNIDLNRATVDEIMDADVPQINKDRAEALVEYRDENGPFESWEDVAQVPGFNDGLINDLQEAGARLGSMDEMDTD